MAQVNPQNTHPKYDAKYDVKSVSHDGGGRVLNIVWADGHTSAYPYIWLRHGTFFPSLGRPEQAHDDWCLLPEEADASVIGAVDAGDEGLDIHWSHDGSTTRHDLTWLRDNCISDEARLARQPKPQLWTAAEADAFEWFDAGELENTATRMLLFEQVRNRGLAFVRNVSVEPGSVMEIARYFGPVRRTHHGSLFDIRSMPQDRQGPRVGIGATAANSQAPHTDESFRHATLGIMLFHCLKPDQSGAGASIFGDGIAAAEALRESDPGAFEFLRTTPIIQAAERNPQERFRTRGRIIATDTFGIVRGVKVADRTMPPMDLPQDQIEPAYNALRAFFAELYAPERILERRLGPGEMAIFDNQRTLHGRKAFNQNAGERHIQQVSIERDEFHNLFRQLAEQLGRFDLANWEPDAGVLSQG